MTLHNALETAIGYRTNIRVLKALNRAGTSLTGRQIARLSGLSVRACQIALARLVRNGLVSQRRVGKAYLFDLRKENLLLEQGILPLLELEDHLLELALETIGKAISSEAESCILFGSVARGEEVPESDIDVCIVLKDGISENEVEDKLDSVWSEIASRYSVYLSPVLMNRKKFREKYLAKDSFVRSIVDTGRVFCGKGWERIVFGDDRSQKDKKPKHK